jgi:hypothetical protein
MTIETVKQVFKFSWAQVFSDQNGKTSVTSLAGAYVTFIGGLSFAYTCIIKDLNLGVQAVIVLGIGSSLLMGNKLVNGKPQDMGIIDPGTSKDTKTIIQATSVTTETTQPQP